MKPETLFSPELMDLYNRFQAASSVQDRAEILVRFAAQFSADHDRTDLGANEHFHGVVEEFDIARQAYTQAALRLGRVGMELINQALEDTDDLDDEDDDYSGSLN